MGYGDELMATGMARGARDRGKRIAFGDGRKIIYGPWSEPVFRNNPNVARPGDEGSDDIEWIAHYKGHRLYNSVSMDGRFWVWNKNFRAKPGELFFSRDEITLATTAGPERGYVVVEPNVPWHKSVAQNKDWGWGRYEALAQKLRRIGVDVIQFKYEGMRFKIKSARYYRAPTFRDAIAVIARASLYVGPEGGLHHGAAAVGTPAVVLFGGFIPPSVTGYSNHVNLTGGAEACGSLRTCAHCRRAMRAITVEEVYEASRRQIGKHGRP